MKDKKMLYGIGIVFLFLATIGFSYAYFTASIANKDVKDQVVTTGTLELTYTDGPEIKMENIKPGQTITKKVTVKNTGTLDASYNFVWQELNNTITNDEMLISATCKRLNGDTEEETCEGVDENPIKRIKIKENVSIEPGITHEYNVTITFKEENADQNYNQGKLFTGVLGIKEYKTPETINCTFDGELTQGSEYTNGQYTYRYMQEQQAGFDVMSHINVYKWVDITTDGWGVTLTDKDSTEPVTSKICTTINNKPVVSTAYMFFGSQATSIDLDTFDTSNVIDMKSMFDTTNFKILDLSNFNTSNVTDMGAMFRDNQSTALDLSSFDTSNVTKMNHMFISGKATTLDLSNFNTSKVVDMKSMFMSNQSSTLNVSSFNTGNVTDMSAMFYNSHATTLDLSNFDTSNVTKMSHMFADCSNLKTIYASDKFVTIKIGADSSSIFEDSINLVGGSGTIYDSTKVDKEYARIDGGTELPGYFTLKTN